MSVATNYTEKEGSKRGQSVWQRVLLSCCEQPLFALACSKGLTRYLLTNVQSGALNMY